MAGINGNIPQLFTGRRGGTEHIVYLGGPGDTSAGRWGGRWHLFIPLGDKFLGKIV
jgi:hypothetical protein